MSADHAATLYDLVDRVRALEKDSHPPARDMVAGPEFDKLSKHVDKLEGRLRNADKCLGEVAAQAARVDNRLTSDKLKEIRSAFELWQIRFEEIYAEHQRMRDELAALRSRVRLCEHSPYVTSAGVFCKHCGVSLKMPSALDRAYL